MLRPDADVGKRSRRREGEEMNEGKWAKTVKIQVGVIIVLVFVIWVALQNPAQWS
jgi:hypothetical protein